MCLFAAGHCGYSKNPINAQVITGEHNIHFKGDGEEYFNVTKIIMVFIFFTDGATGDA